jgi:hypothetical protein
MKSSETDQPTAPATAHPRRARWTTALLRPFTKVMPDEAATLALMTIGLAFFLWVGLFSYIVVAQFWALGLFPLIGAGSSLGAVVFGPRSHHSGDLDDALQQIGQAARSVRSPADSLDRHPESLVRGRK